MSFPPVPGADWFHGAPKLQAITPGEGYALVDGTGTILSWEVPASANGIVMIVFVLSVTEAETGGRISLNWTLPGGTPATPSTVQAGGEATPDTYSQGGGSAITTICEPGTTVYLDQATALTAGAATVWAAILGC
jgi:hypothetical protein